MLPMLLTGIRQSAAPLGQTLWTFGRRSCAAHLLAPAGRPPCCTNCIVKSFLWASWHGPALCLCGFVLPSPLLLAGRAPWT